MNKTKDLSRQTIDYDFEPESILINIDESVDVEFDEDKIETIKRFDVNSEEYELLVQRLWIFKQAVDCDETLFECIAYIAKTSNSSIEFILSILKDIDFNEYYFYKK